MQRQDLAGYVLLGDPAVRLPIAEGRATDGDGAQRIGDMKLGDAEAAVLAVLRGDPVASSAGRHGLDPAELSRLVASYRAAGLAALDSALGAALDAALKARRDGRGA
jgi:hypothetical protein